MEAKQKMAIAGSVAGTLHRSFNEAKKAGVAEFRRGPSSEQKIAG
jgi:hypothetical protein